MARLQMRRAWTATELALQQGFPVLKPLGSPFGQPRVCCSYVEGSKHLEGRSYVTVNYQVGNSQQVPVVGAVLLYILLCIERKDVEQDRLFAFCRSRLARDYLPTAATIL